MTRLRVCIDVPDLDRGIAFYRDALALLVVRRHRDAWAELGGAGVSVDLLAKNSGTTASPRADARRDYGRHWTPVHLDVEVDDLAAGLPRAETEGAVFERPIEEAAFGRIAGLADPFGHGFCLVELRGRGYDELLAGEGAGT
jgi:catechol 2,3-dioxygenase-like lactoylglutathione lyase family enzyme